MIRAFAMLFCAIILPSAANAADCPRARAPVVNLDAKQSPATYDTTRDLAALQKMQIDNSVHRSSNAITLGAAASRLGIEYQMKFEITRLPTGAYCVAMTQVDVTIAFTGNNIFIARELPSGSCIYREVLAHENRHFNTDLDVIRDWRARMEMNVQSAVHSIGQVRANSAQAGQTTIQQRLAPILKQQTDALTADRMQRQALVDSPREYERIGQSCNGEGQKYVQQYLQRQR